MTKETIHTVCNDPVLPDDVANEVRYLRFEHCNRAADMLERLARENTQARSMAEYWKAEHLAGNERIAELDGLLKAAACPQCGVNKDGAYYDNMGQVHQCQWCYEVAVLFSA